MRMDREIVISMLKNWYRNSSESYFKKLADYLHDTENNRLIVRSLVEFLNAYNSSQGPGRVNLEKVLIFLYDYYIAEKLADGFLDSEGLVQYLDKSYKSFFELHEMKKNVKTKEDFLNVYMKALEMDLNSKSFHFESSVQFKR